MKTKKQSFFQQYLNKSISKEINLKHCYGIFHQPKLPKFILEQRKKQD